jgi:hypothetical protein
MCLKDWQYGSTAEGLQQLFGCKTESQAGHSPLLSLPALLPLPPLLPLVLRMLVVVQVVQLFADGECAAVTKKLLGFSKDKMQHARQAAPPGGTMVAPQGWFVCVVRKRLTLQMWLRRTYTG